MKNMPISPGSRALEAQTLGELFIKLAERSVRYAVLRNFEQLPESVGARDIDIVVLPQDLEGACDTVFEVASHLGLSLANRFRDERLMQFTLVRRLAPNELFDLKIDFFTNSQVYGVETLSAEWMIADARGHNGIPVVADAVMLLDKWLYHLIIGQPLHPKYDAKFADIIRTNHEVILSVLTPVFGAKAARAQVAVVAAGQGSSLPVLNGPARRDALWRLWRRQGALAVPRTFRFLAYRLRDRLRPHGNFLAISGPDGSGKTTVIDFVLAELKQIYGADCVHYRHFRPTTLPRIAEVAKSVRAVATVDVEYDRPHRALPSGKLGSLARFGYYWLDYLIGYWRQIHPALVRRDVVLFDRYVYDMICDPGRSRISLPMSVLRLILHMMPLPCYAFFIQVDPDRIYERKQELTLEKIKQLNVAYNDLVERGWLIPIDNNEDASNAAAAIVDCIVADRQQEAIRARG